jgi:DNA-binding NarL/FixJ family response regulator
MKRLLFIDDDQTELTTFQVMVKDEYDYVPIHWPDESSRLFIGPMPQIIISDLYMPSNAGDRAPTPTEREAAAAAIASVAQLFSDLQLNHEGDDKARLKRTIDAISEGYRALRLQWTALGQSPDHGLALLTRLKEVYPEVPFVFYSRKIRPEDVTRVLRAGATDAIRKGAVTREELLARLSAAQRRNQVVESQIDVKPQVKQTPTERPSQSMTERLTAKEDSTVPAKLSADGKSDVVSPTSTKWVDKAKAADSWLTAGAKLFGLATAIATFLLAGSKLIAWFHEVKIPAQPNRDIGLPLLTEVLAWYVAIYLLFVMGGVFSRVFEELWKGMVFMLRLIPSLKTKLVGDRLKSIRESVPRLFRLAWDACVVVLAVSPALKYIAVVVTK